MNGRGGGRLSLRRLAQDAGQYGLAEAITKCAWLVSVPVFARILAPAEFGVVELVTSLGWVILPLIVLGQDFSLQRYFFEGQRNRQGVVAAAVAVAGLSSLAWLVAGQAVAALGAAFLSPTVPLGGALHLGLAWVCVNGYFRLLRVPLRLSFRIGAYFQVSLLNAAGGLALSLALVGIGVNGLVAYFTGLLISALLATILAAVKAWPLGIVGSVRAEDLRRLLTFGAAFVPIMLLDALTTHIDRFFLTRWLGLESTGIYALAQKAALFVEFPLVMFSLAWVPRALEAYHDHPEAYGPYYGRTMSLGLLLFSGLAAAVTLLAPEVIAVLGPPAYRDAVLVVAPLSVLVVGMAMGRICSVAVVVRNRPGVGLLVTAIALAAHVIAALLLIPRFGVWGVALAAAGAQWVLGLGYYLAAARLLSAVRWDHRVVIMMLMLCTAVAVWGPGASTWALGSRLLLLAVTASGLGVLVARTIDVRQLVMARRRRLGAVPD